MQQAGLLQGQSELSNFSYTHVIIYSSSLMPIIAYTLGKIIPLDL